MCGVVWSTDSRNVPVDYWTGRRNESGDNLGTYRDALSEHFYEKWTNDRIGFLPKPVYLRYANYIISNVRLPLMSGHFSDVDNVTLMQIKQMRRVFHFEYDCTSVRYIEQKIYMFNLDYDATAASTVIHTPIYLTLIL